VVPSLISMAGYGLPVMSVTPDTDPAPNPHATKPKWPRRARTATAQVLYHDWEAKLRRQVAYQLRERCIEYARGRFDAVAGEQPLPSSVPSNSVADRLFLLNLMQAGVAKSVRSPTFRGMVKVALKNAEHSGSMSTAGSPDAETIPYEDNTSISCRTRSVAPHSGCRAGTARGAARAEAGGRFVFAGEPSTAGDFYAVGSAGSPGTRTRRSRACVPRRWRGPSRTRRVVPRSRTEAVVDIHTFDPSTSRRSHVAPERGRARTPKSSPPRCSAGRSALRARRAGGELGMGWAMFAMNGWKRMSWLDDNVLRHRPRQFFYTSRSPV